MANSVSRMTSMAVMDTNRRHAVAALAVAGLLWGSTVPLSKLALRGWLRVADRRAVRPGRGGAAAGRAAPGPAGPGGQACWRPGRPGTG